MSRAADRLLTEAQKLHRKGQLDAARRRYDALLEQDPHHGEGRLYRALLLQNQGQIRDALGEARQAMADIADPEPALQMNYGVLLKNAGYVQEAEEAYRQALAKAPQSTAIKANLATVLMLMGRVREAEPMFWELTRVMEEPAPWLNLARLSLRREDWEQAREQLHAAEDLDPANPEVHLLRAQRFEKLQDHESAFGCLDAVFRRAPASREAWELLERLDPQALDIEQLGRWAQRLHASGAQSAVALTAAVNLCRRQLIWEVLPALERMLTEALQAGLDRVPQAHAVFTLLGARVPQSAHLVAAKAHWRALARAQSASGLADRSLPLRDERSDRIRVAILSSDFRQHAGGTMIVGLIENLPRGQVEWYAYSNSFDDASAFRERLRSGFDRFINVAALTDQELAEKIRKDGIDILIDRNGMTRDTRVKVLAYRPAPIQARFMGLPGSDGAEGAVDYFIGDRWTLYEGNADGFSEHFLRLPRNYFPNDPQRPDLSIAGTRADHGLPDEGPVLCCFNQHWKISPETWALWCRILEQVPDAVLWLLAPQTEALAEQFRSHLREYGIDEQRLVFARKLPHGQHIARTQHADLVLDTVPYNAHTTACDALRVGVPVLTRPGETFAARVAASILETSDLSEWVVDSDEAYVQEAVAFISQDREQIDQAKAQVYQAYWSSEMPDMARMGRMFEAMCLQLYDRHAAGHEVTHLDLTANFDLQPAKLPEAPDRVVPSTSTSSSPEPVEKQPSPAQASQGQSQDASGPSVITYQGVKLANDEHLTPQLKAEMSIGNYETQEAHLALQWIQDGDRVLELGGCLGFLSAYIKLNHPDIEICSVEPHPDLAEKVRETFRLNEIDGEVLAYAVGPDDQEQVLYVAPETWSHSLIDWGNAREKRTVPGVSMRELLGQRQPNVLICDIEGSEEIAFEGLTASDVQSVRVVIVEFHKEIIGLRGIQRAVRTLEGCGFVEHASTSGHPVRVFVPQSSTS